MPMLEMTLCARRRNIISVITTMTTILISFFFRCGTGSSSAGRDSVKGASDTIVPLDNTESK
jgi:hypothetical protein